MSLAAPPAPPEVAGLEPAPKKAAKKKEQPVGVKKGGWFVRIAIIVIVVIWLIPTVGVLVTSFRPENLVDTTGWWTAFGHPFRAERVDARQLPECTRRRRLLERAARTASR